MLYGKSIVDGNVGCCMVKIIVGGNVGCCIVKLL